MSISCKYLIVGGGMAADAAVQGIREVDSNGSIVLLSTDSNPPYDRPPLSKKLWSGKAIETIFRETGMANVDVRLQTRAVSGDPEAHVITDNLGDSYRYEKLLLATGGNPRHLPFDDQGIVYFRTLDDYRTLRSLADRRANFVVIGGGFIGSEIAAALAMNDCNVSMIFPGPGIGADVFPPGLVASLNAHYRDHGVTLMPGEQVAAVAAAGDEWVVSTDAGNDLRCGGVVAGIGIVPDTDLAGELGLAIDNGIVVDGNLRTSDRDIYAAGDNASFYSSALGMRRRVEHEDNANTMGAMAGRNMAGRSETYDYLPYFYSDLFDLGYEAVGLLGSDMEMVEDWSDAYRKGVVYYRRDGKVRGVLLWNTWGQVDAARELISSNTAVPGDQLRGRIPG